MSNFYTYSLTGQSPKNMLSKCYSFGFPDQNLSHLFISVFFLCIWLAGGSECTLVLCWRNLAYCLRSMTLCVVWFVDGVTQPIWSQVCKWLWGGFCKIKQAGSNFVISKFNARQWQVIYTALFILSVLLWHLWYNFRTFWSIGLTGSELEIF